MWLASIATEIGPTVAAAVIKAFSSPDVTSTKPVSSAPTLVFENLHFPF